MPDNTKAGAIGQDFLGLLTVGGTLVPMPDGASTTPENTAAPTIAAADDPTPPASGLAAADAATGAMISATADNPTASGDDSSTGVATPPSSAELSASTSLQPAAVSTGPAVTTGDQGSALFSSSVPPGSATDASPGSTTGSVDSGSTGTSGAVVTSQPLAAAAPASSTPAAPSTDAAVAPIALASFNSTLTPAPLVSVAGNSESTNNTAAPDSSLAVGPTNVVTTENSRIQWYDKNGVLQSDENLFTFFGDNTVQMGDSHVVYDNVNGRFVVETDTRNSIRIAVSKDSNPNDGWFLSSINTALTINGQAAWSDFPGLATDGKAVYLTSDMKQLVNGNVFTDNFIETHLWIINTGVGAGGFYDGGPAKVADFSASTVTGGQFNYFGQAAEVLSPTPGSIGTFFVNPTAPNGQIQIVTVSNPTTSPTFQLQTLIGALPSAGQEVNALQPADPTNGSATTPISSNTVGNAVWQNGQLYMAATMVPTSGPDAGNPTIEWVRINGSNPAALTIADQGSISGSAMAAGGTATYLPAISADSNGDFAIVFNASGPSLFAGAYYALHNAGDAAGTIELPQTLHAGSDVFQLPGNTGQPPRFGDYSGIGLDPANGNSFWMYGEYAATRASGQTGNWGTQIGEVGAFAFQPMQLVLNNFGTNAGGWASETQYPRALADVNGDGLADIVGFGASGIWVSLATGGGQFGPLTFGLNNFGSTAAGGGWVSQNQYPRTLGDVNGDGRADIVGFGDAGTWVALSTGGGTFAQPFLALNNLGASPSGGGWVSADQYPRAVADVNGDGIADLVGFGFAGTWVALGTGSGHFAQPSLVLNNFGFSSAAGGWTSQTQYPRFLADVNGDGMADIVGFGNAGTFVSLATGGGHFAQPTLVLPNFGVNAGGWVSQDQFPRVLADVNGDGHADIVGFGNSGVAVAHGNSNGTFSQPVFDFNNFAFAAGGWTSDDTFPRTAADVTGDHKADLVGFGAGGVWVAASMDVAGFAT